MTLPSASCHRKNPSRVVVLTAALLAFPGLAKAQGSSDPPPIIGTWLLEGIVDTLADGSLYYWMGHRPTGAIMYDLTGHMSVQFLRDPRPTFSDGAAAATPVELRAAYDGYYAYFG